MSAHSVDRPAHDSFLRACLGLSLVLHLLAAYFSVGYHSADEQFQILEFLGYKLGLTPAKDLAVEFGERMRPWLQPGIYYGITRGAQSLGIQDPHVWAFLYRLVTSLLGWLSLVTLASCVRQWATDRRTRQVIYLSIALIWFLPALQARPSSESLSGSAFLLGATMALSQTQTLLRAGLAGVALGLAFEARFQCGILVGGLFLWWLILGPRRAWKWWASATAGFVALFSLGRLADFWGYGVWDFSPYRYFEFNLIRNKVNEFGVSPWWDVFRMSFTESWPLLGTLALVVTLIAWIRHPKHPFSWAYAPLFLVHILIPHKELRFFFPIALALPVFWVMAFSSRSRGPVWDFGPIQWPPRHFATVSRYLVAILFALNLSGLIALTFAPFARTVQFYEGVSRHAPGGGAIELHTTGRDPYEILGTPIGFYRPAGLKVTRVGSFSELSDRAEIWLFTEKPQLPEATPGRCEVIYRTLPLWIERFGFELNGQNWVNRTNIWTLWRCQNANPMEPPTQGKIFFPTSMYPVTRIENPASVRDS